MDKSIPALDAATGEDNKLAAEITNKVGARHDYNQVCFTDKRGYAGRLLFAVRTIDNLLKQGLPHLKIGRRRVRICIPEADAWMKERFGQQRRGSVRKHACTSREAA